MSGLEMNGRFYNSGPTIYMAEKQTSLRRPTYYMSVIFVMLKKLLHIVTTAVVS